MLGNPVNKTRPILATGKAFRRGTLTGPVGSQRIPALHRKERHLLGCADGPHPEIMEIRPEIIRVVTHELPARTDQAPASPWRTQDSLRPPPLGPAAFSAGHKTVTSSVTIV